MFVTVAETRRILEEWREDYNGNRPHGALGGKAPWFTVQPITPQSRQEPLTCHWDREWGRVRGSSRPYRNRVFSFFTKKVINEKLSLMSRSGLAALPMTLALSLRSTSKIGKN